MDEDTVVALSRKRIVWLVLASCGFVMLGAFLLSLDVATIQAQRRFNSPFVVYGVAVACIVFFGAAGGVGVKKFFDRRPGLVFSRAGVLDNSSGTSAGLIPWDDVVGFDTREVHKQQLLIVRVRDPERYIRRGGRVRQALMRANHRMCGSPIAITASALSISFPELLTLFQQYAQRYARS